LTPDDLDRWVELADGQAGGADADGVDVDVETSMNELRERLLAVLADDEASMVPPSAGDLSPDEWNALDPAQRQQLQRQQLSRLDPRLIPRTMLRPSRHSSRRDRH
jgi:hypothetical protein